MRFFLLKLLSRLLSAHFLQPQIYDQEKVGEWLLSLDLDSSGYRPYYTWRKKTINDTIALGLEMKEYWVEIGRLMELKTLNAFIREQVEKQKRMRLVQQRADKKEAEAK